MSRRLYTGGAVATTLVGSVTSGASTGGIAVATGWPVGGPFAICLGRGLPSEEKILASRSGTTLTFITRGYDGTTPQSHSPGDAAELIVTAVDLDEANAHVNATDGVHGLAVGEHVVGDTTTQTLQNKTIDGGANTLQNVPEAAVTGLVTFIAAVNAALATFLNTATGDARYLQITGGSIDDGAGGGDLQINGHLGVGDYVTAGQVNVLGDVVANGEGNFGAALLVGTNLDVGIDAIVRGVLTLVNGLAANSDVTVAGALSVTGNTALTAASASDMHPVTVIATVPSFTSLTYVSAAINVRVKCPPSGIVRGDLNCRILGDAYVAMALLADNATTVITAAADLNGIGSVGATEARGSTFAHFAGLTPGTFYRVAIYTRRVFAGTSPASSSSLTATPVL